MDEPGVAERTLETGRDLVLEPLARRAVEQGRHQRQHPGGSAGRRLDCDGDTILALVDQTGVACHTGGRDLLLGAPGRCGGRAVRVARRTRAHGRRSAPRPPIPESSYTARLLAKGIDTVCKKVGEEATEVVLAAKGDEHGQVVYESADLLYHLTVLWQATGVGMDEVAAELDSRRA